MTPEGKVKAALKKRLDELKAYHFWPVQTGFGTRTVDCIGGCKGRFFGIEVKRPGAEPTLLQQLALSAIKESGGMAFIIDSVETARDFSFDDSKQAE